MLIDNPSNSELIYLEPKKLRFFKRDGDALRVTLSGDRTYLKVSAACAYPLSDPHHLIGIRDDIEGPEVGVIRDLRELDHESRTLLEEELHTRYFTPLIERFSSIKNEFGAVYFEAETDKGDTQFVVRGLRENIVEIDKGRYLITDIDGNRYELPDSSKLDQKSYLLWERLI